MLRLFLTSREQKKKIKNAQSRNRTSDTRIFSPLLYQLSYLGIYKFLEPTVHIIAQKSTSRKKNFQKSVNSKNFEKLTMKVLCIHKHVAEKRNGENGHSWLL